MKTIVAGSRDISDYRVVEWSIENAPFDVTAIVSGCAAGVDTLGALYAERHNLPVFSFPADWKRYGRSAGYRRNVEMAESAEALIAVWDGKSRGTKHMIDIAKAKGLRVFLNITDEDMRRIAMMETLA